MGEMVAAVSGVAAVLLTFCIWYYFQECRRDRSARRRSVAIAAGHSVRVPIQYEDAVDRTLEELPAALNGRFSVHLAGDDLLVGSIGPSLLGDQAIFWNRLLEDVRSDKLPRNPTAGDVYVLARLPFPVGGRVALRFSETDWDAICAANRVSKR